MREPTCWGVALLFVAVAIAVCAEQSAYAAEPEYRGKPAAQWLDSLTSHDDAVRESAIKAIAADPKSAKPVLDELVGHLGDRDILRRLCVRQALAAAGPAAVPSLLDGLLNPNPVVQRTSFSALLAAGVPQLELARALIRLLPKLSPEIEQKVWFAVADMGSDAAPAVIEASRYRGPKAAQIHEQAIGLLLNLNPKAGPVMHALMECLHDPSPALRRKAAEALRSVPASVPVSDAAAVAVALQKLAVHDAESQVRAAARVSLGFVLKRPETQRAAGSLPEIKFLRLLGDLHDRDLSTVRRAAFELANLGPAAAEAKPALAALLSHPDFATKSIAAAALAILSRNSDSLAIITEGIKEGQSLSTEVIELLVKCNAAAAPILLEAGHRETGEEQRKYLASALLRVTIRPEDTPLLRSLLTHEAPYVRAWAEQKLTDIRDRAPPTIAELARRMVDADERTRERAAIAMMDMGHAALPALIEVAQDKNPLARRKAVFVISVIGKPSNAAIDALVQALDDDDEQVRFWACIALGRVKDQPLRLAPLMIARQTDASERVRTAARNAFQQLTLSETAH
jgi:hypothetical protein